MAKTDILKDYRFMIDDFTDAQLFELNQICYADRPSCGSSKLTQKMIDEMKYQSLERNRFYWAVGHMRLNRTIADENSLLHRIFAGGVFTNLPDKLQFTKWHPPCGIKEAVSVQVPKVCALAGLPPGCEKLSGWERLKMSFSPRKHFPHFCRLDTVTKYNLSCVTKVGTYSAVFFGAAMAYEHALRFRTDFDKKNTTQFYTSKYNAIRARHNAFLLGLARYGFRWGWRIGFLTSSFTAISQSLCIYRLHDSCWHYMLGAGLPFALYNWQRGLRGMATMGVTGALVVGLPIGFLFSTCSCNLRATVYDCYIAPKVVCPRYWVHWSSEQWRTNEQRMCALRHILDSGRARTSDADDGVNCLDNYPNLLSSVIKV